MKQYINVRFELINHTERPSMDIGRLITAYSINVAIDIQDNGKTIKIFLSDKE